jgi:NAD(P)-dependent dehydrogenase (short-subunit alcohol dehydrogenase family)
MEARRLLVTGAASGINAAVAARLREQGHAVITADLHDADIIADLSTIEGREHLVAEAGRLAPEGLDGVVAGAGITGLGAAGKSVQVNFFGAVATLEGLYPALLKSASPRAVAVVSTASRLPVSATTVAACLAGDEARAVEAAEASPATAYASGKYALARWIRARAIRPDWAGRGIALNGVAPGGVHTPMMPGVEGNPDMHRIMTNTTPKAVAAYADPEDLAEVICWLATAETAFLLGQILFVDGGADAILRPDDF